MDADGRHVGSGKGESGMTCLDIFGAPGQGLPPSPSQGLPELGILRSRAGPPFLEFGAKRLMRWDGMG